MLKELIVSVNGREKKIAIIENGKVTEFYIERGESEQGIVGNIYKGRVMRVLPGMQSAFVDIGLERDAFLYVSDFFDEEEEFERIVIDKPKDTGLADSADNGQHQQSSRQSSGRDQRAATSLRHEPEETTDVAGMMPDADEEELTSQIDETGLSQPPEPSAEGRSVEQTEQRRPEANQRNQRDRYDRHDRRDRNNRRGGERFDRQSPNAGRDASSSFSAPASAIPDEEPIETPFAAPGPVGSFERISDDDERAAAAEDGSMLKDAMMQERIFDRIHAVEFDLENAILEHDASSAFTNISAASFERIDDGGESGDGSEEREGTTAPQIPEAVAAHIDSFNDDTTEEAINRRQEAAQFQRISDDEGATEPATPAQAGASEIQEAPATAAGKTSRRSARGSSARSASSTGGGSKRTRRASTETPEQPATSEAADESSTETSTEADPSATKRGRGGRAKAESAKATKGTSSRRASSTGNKRATKGETQAAAEGTELGDAEASVGSSRGTGEFATRRGGRRRRRGGSGNKHTNGDTPNTPNTEERGPQNGNGEVEVMTDNPELHAEVAPIVAATTAAVQAPPPTAERYAGGSGNRNRHADQRGKNRRNERPPQPTITDLLREGQEIIVQIAKEPISQKGARITSHIALPGRFLVYMPTIEHVGVSRKIESDSERVRLRKLIQLIRAEEDVPSGGFIVRTAGVGISEEDLRDDARYLVRTWLDIRRSAEKTKAPAPVHRDLDLVQRLLRDQLSDEFSAIRVDSEEEYLRIVEFVNRIQPRLVKRVKLYTRDQPILEAYGVQAEVDKAVKPRVWLRSGGYLVINQTEALVAIDVNTGKFVGRGGNRLEDTITKTNLEAVEEIVRQIRLRDLGGIIVLDLIDMEERRNRHRVMQALQEALQNDKSPTKVLSFNDFGLVIMTRKRVKQSLERTLCAPCSYCQGAGLIKSAQTVCYEVLEEARSLARGMENEPVKQVTLRVNPEVARALRTEERDVLTEIEEYLGALDITSDESVHQEQFDFAFV